MYARGRRAGAVDVGAMDGKATTALPARAPAAAGAHSRRVDRVLVRASPDVAVRVWGGHVRAGARRGVQFVERAGAGAVTAGLFTLTLMAMYGNMGTPSCEWSRFFAVRLGSVAARCRR
jgi:hypothetical protein